MLGRILQQSLRRQARRKALAVAAVAAGMAAATAMLSLRVNLGDDLHAELRAIGANLVVTPAADSLPIMLNGVDLRPAGSGALLAEADLPQIETIFWSRNLTAFTPVLDAQATAGGEAITVEGTWFDHAVPVPGEARVVRTGMRRLAGAWQVAGAWPREDAQQALVGAALAARLGVSAGSELEAQAAGGRAARLLVTGIVTTGAAEDNEIVAPLGVAQQLAGAPGRYRQLLVAAVTKPEDAFARRDRAAMTPDERERWMCSPYAASIAAEIEQALPGASARVLRPVAAAEGAILSRVQGLLWLLTGLAVGASGLAIASAMGAAVLERRGEIALMKAVGAGDGTVGLLLLAEAAGLALAGAAAGFVIGTGLAGGVAARILGHGLEWKPALVPLILLLALGAALGGSAGPLRRAVRIQPAEGLRGV
jgi:putative ABC transport system permease protein